MTCVWLESADEATESLHQTCAQTGSGGVDPTTDVSGQRSGQK